MTNVLVRFVYRNGTFMDDGIYDAIEFTANPIINQPNRNQCTSTVTQTITAAIKAHVAVTHRLTAVNVDVQTAHFVWKDGGRGSNLMKMDEEKARNQVALARDRGCVDHIHIEFTTRDSFRTRASRASRASGWGGSEGYEGGEGGEGGEEEL
ncbi:hypothetical protein CHU98_g2189 [Xylaria longipes]|nr:hypothetical protein CHU98_g2189 [Xylaria longipes]